MAKIEDRDSFIQEHYGFIIKNLSEISKRYIEIENDDLFSVGLMAFDEAIDKYDENRGPFYAFAKLVIRSRALNYLEKESKAEEDSLDQLLEEGQAFADKNLLDQELREDILAWQEDLRPFEIDFDHLVEEAPKHQDTRKRAIKISEKSSRQQAITDFMFEKFRLPISKVARLASVSLKVVRRSKVFITAVIIIFFKKYESLLAWMRGL